MRVIVNSKKKSVIYTLTILVLVNISIIAFVANCFNLLSFSCFLFITQRIAHFLYHMSFRVLKSKFSPLKFRWKNSCLPWGL